MVTIDCPVGHTRIEVDNFKGCPYCKIAILMQIIADNCDPLDMTTDEAKVFEECHRIVHSENY